MICFGFQRDGFRNIPKHERRGTVKKEEYPDRAGYDPPPNDAECADREGRNVLVLLWSEYIREVILP